MDMENLRFASTNNIKWLFILLVGGLLLIPVIQAATKISRPSQSISSIYTSLSGKKCKTLSVDDETGSTVMQCSGIANYSLKVLTDDSRQSVNVISPDKKEYPLNYWQIITPYFSSLGSKAEWRILTTGGVKKPVALIIRVNASEQKDVDAKIEKRSYLAVAKITKTNICVTDKILPVINANEQARIAADNSMKKSCLK